MNIYIVFDYECYNDILCVFDSYSKALEYALDYIFENYFDEGENFDELKIKHNLNKFGCYESIAIRNYEVI